jgi:ubiquinone/menaquinone biosynthesis C-methylase UbiE
MSDRHEHDAVTRGHVLHGAHLYDLMANVLTLGHASALREQTADLAALRSGERVLEVGCGTGEVAQRARTRVGPAGQVSGIDPSADMVAVARRKATRAGLSIDYQVALIEALPFADGTFDVVLSSLMMHHLPDDLKAVGLAEVRRVLKPGGRLLIVDFTRPRGLLSHVAMRILLHGRLAHGFQDLPGMLTGAGFGNVTSGTTRFPFLGFVAGRAPA